MSDSCSIRWLEQLLFGPPSAHSDSVPPPPRELTPLVVRMEAEHVPWSHLMRRGGLVSFPYHVHGDLGSLIDHLQEKWSEESEEAPDEPAPFRTRAVARFWHDLRRLLALRDEKGLTTSRDLPEPPERDDDVLRDILESDGLPVRSYRYRSAAFWGEVARRFVNLRRPETASALPDAPEVYLKRAMLLYDVTCVARGQFWDPYVLRLVHDSEHVDAAHWRTPENLEAFLRDRPSHPLALSVRTLLRRSVDQLLRGEKPVLLAGPCAQLDALLHNLQTVHRAVQQVPHENAPPVLIDVFQRLLALSRRDDLWEETVPVLPPARGSAGTSLLYLTERLRIAEREKRLLWLHLAERDEGGGESDAPLRICRR